MRGSYTKAVSEAKRAVEKLYDFEFGVVTGSLKKFKKEIDWEEKRERELAKEWAKQYGANTWLFKPEEILFNHY